MGNTTTPKTDLEIFQALQIEALQKELLRHKEFIAEMAMTMEEHINSIDVDYIEIK